MTHKNVADISNHFYDNKLITNLRANTKSMGSRGEQFNADWCPKLGNDIYPTLNFRHKF